MIPFLYLCRREFESLFRTSIAYLAGAVFLLLTGFSFWMLVARLAQGATDGGMATILFGSPWFWLPMLITPPVLTMRLFAEERRQCTLETLLTAPVTESQVVLAKFAAAWLMLALLWMPTLAYPFLLRLCGAQMPPLDWGPVAAGYLGTALIGAFFLSLGLLCSLLTRHQVVAAISSLSLLGILLSGGLLPFYAHLAFLRRISRLFSAPLHMLDFASGLVDSRTVVWYLTSTALVLFLSLRILEARRLR